ncbi:MAG: T9SS type A sorting domain-containing protein [Anaerolineales bacterium]|nr:T9SS type A sorting domain-containing protein [Anaerolineales bacterium]
MYPNPAGDELTVEYDGADQAVFELYDMLGRPLVSVKLSDNHQIIHTAQLSKGMYYASIRSNGRLVQVGKVVIQE